MLIFTHFYYNIPGRSTINPNFDTQNTNKTGKLFTPANTELIFPGCYKLHTECLEYKALYALFEKALSVNTKYM